MNFIVARLLIRAQKVTLSLFILFILCFFATPLFAQQREKAFEIRVSALAGLDIVHTINEQSVGLYGVRAGVQLPSGVYGGLIASLHPMAFQSRGFESRSAAPIVLGGEAGYEFVLTPIMFLRPYIGLCRFGVNGSYRGNNMTISPERETTEFMLGVTYSIEVARDLLIGAELRGVNRGGLHFCIHAGFRL